MKGTLYFLSFVLLAIQDSSKGDLITQSLTHSVSQVLISMTKMTTK